MSLCKGIEDKLVGQEELSPAEQSHVSSCPVCSELASGVEFLDRAGEQLAEFGRVEPDQVAQLTDEVAARSSSGPRLGLRLALAASSLVVCLVFTSLVLIAPDEGSAGPTVEPLMTLLEDVEGITAGEGEQDDEIAVNLEYDNYLIVESEDEGELELPGSYQVLDDILQERSL